MIKLIPVGVFEISPGDTPTTVRNCLMTAWGLNFTSHIQETKTGRYLGDDEPLIDDREYYISFDYDLPPKRVFREPIVSKSKYQKVE
jgi:hypothetical protein